MEHKLQLTISGTRPKIAETIKTYVKYKYLHTFFELLLMSKNEEMYRNVLVDISIKI